VKRRRASPDIQAVGTALEMAGKRCGSLLEPPNPPIIVVILGAGKSLASSYGSGVTLSGDFSLGASIIKSHTGGVEWIVLGISGHVKLSERIAAMIADAARHNGKTDAPTFLYEEMRTPAMEDMGRMHHFGVEIHDSACIVGSTLTRQNGDRKTPCFPRVLYGLHTIHARPLVVDNVWHVSAIAICKAGVSVHDTDRTLQALHDGFGIAVSHSAPHA
jgi:hypothetical protein